MPRRSAETLADTSMGALVDALSTYGLITSVTDDGNGGRSVGIGPTRFDVEVSSIVTAAEAREMAKQWGRRPTPVILVANRIAEDGREVLAAAGVHYFDRRGPLRLVAPPLVIDTTIEPAGTNGAPATPPLSSQVAKEVAIACLLTPDAAHGVREVASFLDRSPSAVSKAMAEFRGEGLLTSRNEPLTPDLFHELVSAWRIRRVSLASPPPVTGSGPLAADLRFDSLDSPGWALTDTVAASTWGMPVVARGDYPPDFYVPSDAALQRAVRILGETPSSDQRGCTVAVASVRLACFRRVAQNEPRTWPLANHIVVALDIAQDKARGMEILDGWSPEGITRAW